MNVKKVAGAVIGLGALVALLVSGCGTLPAAEVAVAAEGPEQVVEDFYTWYLDYVAYDVEAGTRENALVDGAYRSNEHLTEDFVGRVDEKLTAMRENGPGGGYDPFLCAQDIPEHVTVLDAQITGDQAQVTVETSFPNHQFSLQLEEGDGGWQIADIVCR
jgi:hypothetical protein